MTFSDHLADRLLDHLLGVESYAAPDIYLALSHTNPGSTGQTLSEPVAGGYARVLCEDWSAAAHRTAVNTQPIVLPQAQAGWGTMTHFALLDAVAGGNLLAYGQLVQPRQIRTGDVARLLPGQVSVGFQAGGLTDVLAHQLLDHLFAVDSFTAPPLYVALSTASPGDQGLHLTEPVDGGYARVIVDHWAPTTGRASQNSEPIEFALAQNDWGIISHVALMNAAAAGQTLIYSQLHVARQVLADDQPGFSAGQLKITLL